MQFQGSAIIKRHQWRRYYWVNVAIALAVWFTNGVTWPAMSAEPEQPGEVTGKAKGGTAAGSANATPEAKAAVASDSANHELTFADSALQELTLNDLQDLGILWRHIRQQAINIYEEASRTPVKLTASADVPALSTSPIHIVAMKLLPARQEWLVFFLGTMEPVIRQLSQEVEDIQKGIEKLVIPESVDKAIDPLWEAWVKDVRQLNAHLDLLLPLFDDAPHNNTKIQAVAVEIYNDVNRLEVIRKEVFRALQHIERKTPDTKILITPPPPTPH